MDDDIGIHETLQAVFRQDQLEIVGASTGQEAMSRARSATFDLWILDFRLPDMTGLSLIRRLKDTNVSPDWILISGFLSTSIIVEAVKLGACEVVEKPVELDSLVGMINRRLSSNLAVIERTSHLGSPCSQSIVTRWTTNVLCGCEAKQDPKTLAQWARCASLSYTSLCESCRLVGVRPLDARDFMRTLRAKVQSSEQRCSPELFLDVSDRRTLSQLIERAGPDFMSGSAESLLRFIRTQRFVNPDHPSVEAVAYRIRTRIGRPE